MSDKFQIITDPARHLLRIKMSGHWNVETVKEYKRALQTAVSEMLAKGCKSGQILALVDIRDGSAAQSQDVLAAYKDEVATEALAPRKLATLVSTALFKRQVERLAIPHQRLFTDEAEAEAWLLSPDFDV